MTFKFNIVGEVSYMFDFDVQAATDAEAEKLARDAVALGLKTESFATPEIHIFDVSLEEE